MKNLISKFFCSLIRAYQICISPLHPPCCRFTPSCSEYAMEAIKKYGPGKGLVLSVKRILRCNPYCKGGFDPVPEVDGKMAFRLLRAKRGKNG